MITVSETNPDGYVSTNAIPGNAASKLDNDNLIVTNTLAGGSTSSGNYFGDVASGLVAIITGTVFDDANENGVFDGGETGISGVTVTLEFSDGSTISVPTDSVGDYQFAVAPGTDVRITSAGPGGSFYPTTVESVYARPPTAGVYPNNNFGYSDDGDVAVIFGLVFDDVNSNGQPDFGEPGLPGAVITLTNSGPPIIATTSGNGLITGTFTFVVNQTDIYGLHEQNPPGYRSTTPDNINVNVVALGRGYPVEFGDTDNPDTATIHGTVFDDLDGNGVQDPSETGLAGVPITVTVGGGTGVLTTTTKTYGQFTYGFDITEEGYHTVSERDPALEGYRSTTPDEVNVLIGLGNSYIVNFGDRLPGADATIMGTVFDDDDGNGAQDPAELGIEGVLISLSNGLTYTTNVNGQYTFLINSSGYVQVI